MKLVYYDENYIKLSIQLKKIVDVLIKEHTNHSAFGTNRERRNQNEIRR